MIPDPRWPLVLIIDDRPQSVEYLERVLGRAELFVYVATNIEHGIDLALKRTPAIIFVDRKFNGIEGYNAGRRIRLHESLSKIPMYLFTDKHEEDGDQEKARAAGFDGYIQKPMDPEGVVVMVRSLLAQP